MKSSSSFYGVFELLLFTSLCAHQQLCQCYAGGSGSYSNRIPSSLKLYNSDNNNNQQQRQQHQLLLGKTKHNGIDIGIHKNVQQNGLHLRRREGNRISKLASASIVTSFEENDEEEDGTPVVSSSEKKYDKKVTERLLVRGGDDSEHGIGHTENAAIDMLMTPRNNSIQSIQTNETTIQSTEQSGESQIEELSYRNEQQQQQLQAQPAVSRARLWPCGDALDKELIKIALPCIANFAINPLVGAVDLFWINRTGNTLAVAGQAAANQIFSSSFWLTSFLPSVTATLVAKECAKGSEEGVQDAVCQALVVGTLIALLGSFFILSQPDRLLGGVLKNGAPAREFAKPYLFIRGFAFLPSMFSLIGFSAFRGTMDTVTPLKISLFANVLNAVLDPILIFTFNMGVTGAAVATLMAEISSAIIFTYMLLKRKMVTPSKMFRLPKWSKLSPLLIGGAALQLRNFALNLTFLAVTRVTQSIDDTGVAAAAHAMAIQTFQIGGIVLLALSTVAQTVVPNSMVEKIDKVTGEKSGGIRVAKNTVSRLMRWGFILGSILGSLQTLLIPYLQKSTPVIEVREAARVPALLASLYQVINGLVFIGEGVMVGCGSFMQLSLSTLGATIATLLALNKFPMSYGLTGVWMSFGVFNSLRLLGVFIHQRINGPMTPKSMTAKTAGITK